MTDEYEVVAQEFRHEIDPVKGSRFLAVLAPASSAEAAEAFVQSVRDEEPGATHHCWAYRVGPRGDRFRFSDDGEPGGSAGRPILQQIEGHGVTETVCVVRRWFGGTKLGVGGLIRAYGGAAARALDLAPRRTVLVTRRVEVRHPYECSRAVDGLLAARALVPVASEYGDAVRVTLDVPERDVERFLQELRDRTAGRAEIA